MALLAGIGATIGGLFGGGDGEGLFQGIFGTKESRQAKRAARKAKRAARKAKRSGKKEAAKASKVIAAITGSEPAPPTQAGAITDKVVAWLQQYWMWLAGAAALWFLFKEFMNDAKPVRRKKKIGGSRRKATRRPKRRATGGGQTRITTKTGKVITGKANVAAYKKKLANLRKAQRARKR